MFDFIVIGLPRSGTTWLANWLTTDHSLCLHDPFSMGWPDTWPRDGRRFGISCTGAYLMPEFMAGQSCPVAIIDRPAAECEASLTELGFPTGIIQELEEALGEAAGSRFKYASIWDEAGAKELWDFLIPDRGFDVLRYRLLAGMQIQPHMGKWRPDSDVISEVSTHVRRK